MSDSPFTPGDSKEAVRYARGQNPRSKCNLIAPVRMGEVRNPEGRNGRTRAEIIAMVLEEPSESDPERRKIEMVIRAQYRRALKGSDVAARTLIEHWGGRPGENPSVLQLAEHIRQVERDRIATAISILGPKLREKSPKEIAAYFAELCNAPDKFLNQAAQLMGETEQPQPEPQPELPPEKTEGEP